MKGNKWTVDLVVYQSIILANPGNRDCQELALSAALYCMLPCARPILAARGFPPVSEPSFQDAANLPAPFERSRRPLSKAAEIKEIHRPRDELELIKDILYKFLFLAYYR